jgi:hypothetical protein
MSLILGLIGWPLAIALAAAAVLSLWRTARNRGVRTDPGAWLAPLGFTVGAVALLTALGVLSPLLGGMAAGGAAILLALLFRPWDKSGRRVAGQQFRGGIKRTGADARRGSRGILGWLRRLRDRLAAGEGEQAGTVPLTAVAEHVATRAIPPVMADPVLGPPTEPGEIAAAGIPVPAPYTALAEFIGSFEPEDDMSLRMFMEGHASGTVTIADAWHAFAETCLNGVGLSPAYVAGILEAGDSAGEHASLLAQVHKRFHVVYAAIKEWISAHGPLPTKAREFLTGED